MCGLTGVILGRKRRKRDELVTIRTLFTGLLLLNQKRGHHATGIAVLRKDGSAAVLKRPIAACSLIQAENYWHTLQLDNAVTVILGHTRYKTQGSERNNANNHPILVGNRVAGTHQGHIRNADALFHELELPRAAEVDSEVLFRMVERAKDDEELKTLIARCEGTISAAWVRRDEPGRVRLLKGDMPLDAAYARRLDAVFYASEAWMLPSVLAREPHRMLDLDPFTLSTFDVSSLLDFTQQDVFFLSPMRWTLSRDEES
ncbi:MAG TPA: glucosamine 6-phosphate synthetase [Planctomycetota bacterium]|mgnify:CR=1 FL=1|nr:glucosamine 6-phosphate synthetase [Planctomycetota bacterium]HRR83339.1 glucosamine 6-phosphate synthetase [Planctomycetota bacterium]